MKFSNICIALLVFVFLLHGAVADALPNESAAPHQSMRNWTDLRTRLGTAYKLGLLLQQPIVSVMYLDGKLKNLKNYASDADAAKAIVDDGKIAATTRTTEAQSYADASKLIVAVGGPQSLREGCDKAAATLTAPLKISNDTKLAGADPITAQILGTLDEADRVKPDPSTLYAWLRITLGRDGLWAYHLGQFSVGLRNTVALEQSRLYEPEIIPQILKYMPRDAPTPIVAAIRKLRGMPQTDPQLPGAINGARDAIDVVFTNGR